MPRHELTLYSRPGCHLCDEMLREVHRALDSRELAVEVVDIDRNAELLARYMLRIPVLALDGEEVCEGRFDPEALQAALRARAPR
ncbi:MAG TPA: glutaredoxin family protein [Gammaproteobacteria bacterium]|nr:glutaredoxin family protein [Gammaproteobacteria bacterium]